MSWSADAATVTADDALLVRQDGSVRWHRCLRCDDWVRGRSRRAGRARVEKRDEIALPLRGAALRDRYVLRLIALDRAIHFIVLTGLAIALLTFAAHDQALHHDYQNIMNDLAGGRPVLPRRAASWAISAGPSSTRRRTCASSGSCFWPSGRWRGPSWSGCG